MPRQSKAKSAAVPEPAPKKAEKKPKKKTVEVKPEPEPTPEPDKPKKERKPRNEEKPKRTRKPSAFNHYMSKRIAELKTYNILQQHKTHKELFALAATEWSAMSKEEQDRIKAELSE